MKKVNLIAILLVIVFSGSLMAQDMTPPPPIESSLLKSMEGTWVSAPYEMMGSNMTDEVTQQMVLNGQFFQVNVKSVSDKGFTYEALVMIAPLKDGTFKGWGYDVFGNSAISTYTGTSEDNALYISGTSSWGTETRNIKMIDGIMIQNVIFNMKGPDGKEMPPMSMSITYNKK